MALQKEMKLNLSDDLIEQIISAAAAENSDAECLIVKAIRFYLKDRHKSKINEEIIKGYREMAEINRNICEEGLEEDMQTLLEYEKIFMGRDD
jgi:CopG family transcriptional regulator/antitoxin EndoAI